MSNPAYNDHPFDEVVIQAKSWVDKGHTIHQKFTCDKCNARQTMEVPNQFYTKGQCEECGHITDIEKRGCNYLLITGVNHGR
jgi:hypothetical protein